MLKTSETLGQNAIQKLWGSNKNVNSENYRLWTNEDLAECEIWRIFNGIWGFFVQLRIERFLAIMWSWMSSRGFVVLWCQENKFFTFAAQLWSFILCPEVVREPQWCRAPFKTCWQNSQSFCMVDIGPGYLLWQLLIKIQHVCPLSPSPHFYSSCFFPLIPFPTA